MTGENGRVSLSRLEIVKLITERDDVRDIARESLIEILEEHAYNVARVIEALGFCDNRMTFYRKLRKYDIDVGEERKKYLEKSKAISKIRH